jgi:GTPase involved in cell partitioning and DNA repair
MMTTFSWLWLIFLVLFPTLTKIGFEINPKGAQCACINIYIFL